MITSCSFARITLRLGSPPSFTAVSFHPSGLLPSEQVVSSGHGMARPPPRSHLRLRQSSRSLTRRPLLLERFLRHHLILCRFPLNRLLNDFVFPRTSLVRLTFPPPGGRPSHQAHADIPSRTSLSEMFLEDEKVLYRGSLDFTLPPHISPWCLPRQPISDAEVDETRNSNLPVPCLRTP